jgi:hypothetical protein
MWLQIAAIVVVLAAQGLNVFLPASGTLRSFLDVVFFGGTAVLALTIGAQWRQLWRRRRGHPESN